MIKLTFTGVGSAFNPRMYNTSCYYKERRKLLLIDCGADTYRRICEAHVLDKVEEIYVCITHTHQDHIGSLGTLIADCSMVNNRKITLILANNDEYRKQILTTLKYAGVTLNKDYTVRDNLRNTFDEIFDVSFFDVSHNATLVSKGYIFYLSSKEIFIYSGDSYDINKVLRHCHNIGKYEFKQAYVDCNLEKISTYSNSKPHEYLKDLLEAIPPEKRKFFTAMHYDSYKCRNLAKENGFNVVYHFTEFEYQLNK